MNRVTAANGIRRVLGKTCTEEASGGSLSFFRSVCIVLRPPPFEGHVPSLSFCVDKRSHARSFPHKSNDALCP